MVDEKLKQYATPRQLEILEAIERTGSQRSAAKELGIARGTIFNMMQAVKKRAAKAGHSPEHDMTRTVPDGFLVKGVSTMYAKDGTIAAQWVKSAVDRERQEAIMREAFEAMSSELPRVAPSKGPSVSEGSLCNVYTFTDCHVGALSWHEEGGADWDLKIAERTLTSAFQHMVDAAPSAKIAFVNQLGDFLHSDGILPVTPTSHHILDQDGRYAKVVGVAIRILRRIVDFALQKHEQVVVLLAEGNHDISSSIWLRAMFSALYENEPRVKVIDSALPYYVYKHGETMLAFHHGHLKKNDSLPLLFASQFPEVWGATKRRVCHVGHRHHVEEKEHSGLTVMQHSTLAARDAYAARGGWMSERQATVITYHEKYGQVSRNTVVPEMFE
jgi:hypothetical protein